MSHFLVGLGLIYIMAHGPAFAQAALKLPNQFHSGVRNTPKLLFLDELSFDSKYKGKDLVEDFLKRRGAEFGVAKDLSNIRLLRRKSSLLGEHFRYVQVSDGIDVQKGEIIITLNKDLRSIRTIYNNLYPFPTGPVSKRPISSEEAYDIAWEVLRVHGPLIETPDITESYLPTGKLLEKVFLVRLSIEKPYGAWQVAIALNGGRIISIEDIRITRRKTPPVDFGSYKGKILDRRSAFANYKSKHRPIPNNNDEILNTDIPTAIFNPDPRTVLNNPDLGDKSSLDIFEEAYSDHILRDISFDGSVHQLKGPWVQIIDYDPPNTAPHSEAESEWYFDRGQNQFNEAMTYYHIDSSQRYMQELGFMEDMSIQGQSIEVDADGANGDDNSYFQPNTNRLSFGHGCVDDNEDADVILHEYGHAIQDDINPSWIGGDTGAMGEGFGDYWAGSYSISTSSGSYYLPNQVFSWDGHGTDNECWNGRILNAIDARYDHNRNYSAHVSIDGGYQSDELWSTPLFQSLLELIEHGIPREQVDKIVLQSHFGLGADLKMRDLALNTLATAESLYPDGPHKTVFHKHFVRHGIIDIPAPKFALSDIQLTDDNDGHFNPGENLKLSFKLKNEGDLDAYEVMAAITSSSDSIEIINGNLNFGSIAQGEEIENLDLIEVIIKTDADCGEELAINFNLEHSSSLESQNRDHIFYVGEAVGVSYSKSPNLEIPDNDPIGIQSSILINEDSYKVSSDFKVHIELAHNYVGDISVQLTNPSGQKVILRNRSGSNSDDLRGTFPDTIVPNEPLSNFIDSDLQGEWKLEVFDRAKEDTGVLESWGVEDIVEYRCLDQ